MPPLRGFGLALDLPPGWDGRITRRGNGAQEPVVTAGGVTAFAVTHHPVVHVANFPLPEQRADFGGGVVEQMGAGDVFAVLFEYGPSAVGTPLFAEIGFPSLAPARFSSSTLQRAITGQAGFQAFFQVARRAFSLYAVLGSGARRARLVPDLAAVLTTLHVDPVAAAGAP